MKSKVQQLHDKYGGTWRYDGQAVWLRRGSHDLVCRTASCTCDEPCDHPARYYYYGQGKCEEVEWETTAVPYRRRRA